MKCLLLVMVFLFTNVGCGSDIINQILSWEADIKKEQDPQKKQRMQKRFNSKLTIKFNQQMQIVQNNLFNSIQRMQSQLTLGQRSLAFAEMNQFKKYLQRFEKLAKVAGKLPQHMNSIFEINISPGAKVGRSFFKVQIVPNLSTIKNGIISMNSNVKRFLANFKLLSGRSANTNIRTPEGNASKGGQGKKTGKSPAVKAPLKIENIMHPGSSTY